MEHICVIFASRPISERMLSTLPREFEYLIAADAGYASAVSLGLYPDYAVGDFDSAPEPEEVVCPLTRYPSEKDDTDTLLAVKKGLELGCNTFYIYGALGGRIDHTFASIQTLAFLKEQNANGVLLDEHTSIFLLQQNERCRISQKEGNLSVFAYSGTVKGVTLRGVQYPLQDGTITNTFPIGISNVVTEEVAEVSVSDGTLLVMCVTE